MKLLKILILSFFLLTFSVKNVVAYSGDNSMTTWEDSVYGKPTEYNSPSFNNETLKNIQKSIISQIYGATQKKYQVMIGGGAIAGVSNLIARIYDNPPASAKEYFADLGKSLGITKPAYAQTPGIGFTGLSKLLPLWKATRNLSYIFFVLASLYIGVALMLRVKLDPKTVISIQNAIPKLVIALVLVTFSYAIAGFMIDLIYLIIYLGVLALREPLAAAQADPSAYSIAAEQAKYANLGFGDIFFTTFGGLFKGVFRTWTTGIGGVIGYALAALAASLAIALPTGLGFLALLIPLLVIGIIVLYLVFKLLLTLVMCYVSIIISVITAPLQIMMGVFPGSKGGFGPWFKNLMANILVFPAVALVVLFGWLLTGTYGPDWSPPALAMSGTAIAPLLGIGILFSLSKIPDMVKEALIKAKPSEFGPLGFLAKSVEGESQKRVGNYVIGSTKFDKNTDTEVKTGLIPDIGESITSLSNRLKGRSSRGPGPTAQ